MIPTMTFKIDLFIRHGETFDLDKHPQVFKIVVAKLYHDICFMTNDMLLNK